MLSTARSRLICVGGLLAIIPTAVPKVAFSQSIYETQVFVHTPEEMLNFDTESYLLNIAPALAPYATTIEHWAVHSSVSPRILLAVMELQTSIISRAQNGEPFDIDRPFGLLSFEDSFRAQTMDVAERLAVEFYRAYYQDGNLNGAAREALTAVIGDQPTIALQGAYGALFAPSDGPQAPQTVPLGVMGGREEVRFSLPFQLGETWAGGGAHSYEDDLGYYTALDFWGTYQDWNEDTSPHFVAAATEGIANRASDCEVVIVGPNGWATGYYHLENILVADGDQVVRGQPIANYANTPKEALCQGGSSSGPHVHFWISHNGVQQNMEGRKLSTFTVHPGRENYDTNCDFSWFERPDGSKVCPNYRELLNEGVPAAFSTSCTDLNCTFDHIPSPDDGTVTQHSWDFGDGNTAMGASVAHDYAEDGTYAVILTLTNDQGVQRSVRETIVVVGNKPPQLSLPETMSLRALILPAELEIGGVVSDDGLPQAPGTVTTQWRFISGPAAVEFSDEDAPTTTVRFSEPGEYVLTLTANDGRLEQEASIQVIVALNAPPTARAGKDQNVALGDQVDLDASTSDDEDGTVARYGWMQVEGPPVTLSAPDSASTSFIGNEVGTVRLHLTVYDNDGASSEDEVQICVVGPGFEGPVTVLDTKVEKAIAGGGCRCVPAPFTAPWLSFIALLLLVRRRR